MKKITKAIIPVAGWGTRRLPITKTIEKCMLPIGNRPLVDYVVQDCLKAGITELIFVVGEGSTQLEDYYRSNIQLNDYLRRNGKQDKLPLVAPLEGVKLHFITQPISYGKYGTAVPVALAADYINEGESAVVLMGDDFFYNEDDSSEVKRLIDATPDGSNGILGAILDTTTPESQFYGSIEVDENDNLFRISEFPDVLPEVFIKNVSKYLLNYDMLQAVKDYVEHDNVNGEYYIFTPFEPFLESGKEKMKLVRAKGQYLDGGNVEGWLHANNIVLS